MGELWNNRDGLRMAGWTNTEIDHALRAGRLVAVTRDALVPADALHDIKVRCGAALSTQREDAAGSHRSAALLHRWPWAPAAWSLDHLPADVTAARDDVTRSSRKGVNRRLAALPDEDVVQVDGLRITSHARTAVDLARTEDRLLAVQLMDWLLTRKLCTYADFAAVTARMVRVPGVAKARRAIALARPGVDSPAETTVRLQAVDAGLEHPDTCLRIEEDGHLLARGDLGYRKWLIWIEYDSWQWHKERGIFASDRARDRWLTRRGWECMRLTDDDVRSPRNWLTQLAQAIADAPDRIMAMDPRRSPEVAEAQALLRRS
ncbi:MAG TPA: hypothetical protein VFH54_17500 [Mycobacteriales bacterium]|nr:hypothetical protein [Mycobacteriales bacterium]